MSGRLREDSQDEEATMLLTLVTRGAMAIQNCRALESRCCAWWSVAQGLENCLCCRGDALCFELPSALHKNNIYSIYC